MAPTLTALISGKKDFLRETVAGHDEKQALAYFLTAQRAAVLAVVAGLDETALTTAVPPARRPPRRGP